MSRGAQARQQAEYARGHIDNLQGIARMLRAKEMVDDGYALESAAAFIEQVCGLGPTE